MANAKLCQIPGCNGPHRAKGYCFKHYLRLRKHGDPNTCLNPVGQRPETCTVDGCDKKHHAHGYCANHAHSYRVYGDPLAARPRAPSQDRCDWINAAVSSNTDECLFYPFAKTPYISSTLNGTAMALSRKVCILAHGEPVGDRNVAAHKCGNGHLNCCNPRHLYWATYAENEADKREHGRDIRGEGQHNATLSEADVRQIRSLRGKMTQKQIAQRFGITQPTVSAIQIRKSWSWLE